MVTILIIIIYIQLGQYNTVLLINCNKRNTFYLQLVRAKKTLL